MGTPTLFGSKQPATDPDITASALTGKHPTSKLAFSVLGYNILGLKVFTDAHMPVTHEEGDRYPLGPPDFCPGDGIGIRVGLRSQILRVRVSPGAPYIKWGIGIVGNTVALQASVSGSTPLSSTNNILGVVKWHHPWFGTM